MRPRIFSGIFIYLWLCFGSFVLYQSLVLAEQNIDCTGYGVALVNALVLGKVILVDVRAGQSSLMPGAAAMGVGPCAGWAAITCASMGL